MLRRTVLGLVVMSGVAACTDEGEGSAAMTGVGFAVIPWWAVIPVVIAWAGVVWLRKRRRR